MNLLKSKLGFDKNIAGSGLHQLIQRIAVQSGLTAVLVSAEQRSRNQHIY